ncbi:MAG: hypothetical protein ACM3NQ_01830 [Bacteroidales bacterium]
MKKAVLVALLLFSAFVLAAESPFTGTWKADLSKAQVSAKPDQIVLQSGRFQCTSCVPKVDVKADGTDQPVVGDPMRDTVAVRVIDDKTVEFTDKRGGKVIGKGKETVSADGKTMTIDFESFPPSGAKSVTGKQTMTRVAAGPAGAHAISGSWQVQKMDQVSENGLMITLNGTDDGLSMTAPTGESFDAKFDGKDYPVKNDLPGTMVSLKKLGERSVEQTIKRDGKVLYVNTMTVAADGKTMTYKSEDKQTGNVFSIVATKQ